MTDDLWYGTSGPPDADIVIVGEAWGREEDIEKKPFMGESGKELNRMLAEAGIQRNDVLCTNVVNIRPLNNEMWRLFNVTPKRGSSRTDKADTEATRECRNLYPTPFVEDSLRRLYRQIGLHPRRLVIAAGNYPLWALSHSTGYSNATDAAGRSTGVRAPTGIMSWRGSMLYANPALEGVDGNLASTKLLPILHPAGILRAWDTRAITVHDLKARVPMALRNDWRPQQPPVFLAPPTFEQCRNRLSMWIARANGGQRFRLVEDIETSRGLITVIGLTDSVNFAMAIPFVKKVDNNGLDSYWTVQQEAEIIQRLRVINSHPNIQIEGQNFLYDTQYIWHYLGVTPRTDFDSMLAQNVLFPGTPKGLDYLSSLYCKYHWYWKDDGKEWNNEGSLEQLLEYNCVDLIRTYECITTQRQLIVNLRQEEQWEFKKKQADLCLRMMQRGVRIDTEKRMLMKLELSAVLDNIHNELLQIIPQSWIETKSKSMWYDSPHQTNWLFYDFLGFRKVTHRKTGQVTGGKEALNELRKRHPEFIGLFDRIKTARSVDNTIQVLNTPLEFDNRMRCSFNPGGTETHRLSSSTNVFGRGTNLQNLTKGEED